MNEAIYLRIKERLSAMGLAEQAACRAAGVGRDAIRDIRRRSNVLPRLDTLTALAGPLGTTPEWLAFGVGPDPKIDEQPYISVPVLSWVAASRFVEMEPVPMEQASHTINVGGLRPGRYIGLTVEGDSMNLIAPAGSTIIVRVGVVELVDRAFYIFQGNDGATFKQFRSNPARLEPLSTNHVHETIFPGADVRPIGRAVRVITEL